MNISEQEISLTLQAMKSKGKWITLQLQPGILEDQRDMERCRTN